MKNHFSQYQNPLRILKLISGRQWLTFSASWLAWTADAFDFFCVSLNVDNIAKEFHKSHSDVTLAILFTLLTRSIGAVIFGALGDRYGRKWPMVGNILLFGILTFSTGFTRNFSEFLAVRSLYGIALGGIYGCAASLAIENLPNEARGIMSGVLQQGYAFGYLLAAAINLAIVPNSKYGWRAIFWFGIGPAVLIAIFRAVIPDEDAAKRRALSSRDSSTTMTAKDKGRVLLKEIKELFRYHWLRLIHAVALMSGFNFMSHGSQDLYPTFLTSQLENTPTTSTKVVSIMNFGAIIGGSLAGYFSQYWGRRITIISLCCVGACFIPLWYLPTDWRILAIGAFFMQFCVQGAWGIIPIHLNEISPSSTLRAVFVGLTYQLGNAISSASATIEATAAEKLKTKSPSGKIVPDYGKTQAIFIGAVFLCVIILTAVSPEYKGAMLEEVKYADGRVVVQVKPDVDKPETVEENNHYEG
ncbi:unnamed protein product [Didymodactylos carnosus]|uniref:Major facilitator superfamily (MFS) profile domain-containing protein n=1 Tax=Didymodactylos carnosus TaxID=1234261 RepID=A0A815IZD4_9BILA|nr:unnamed protein product [Didymodactylos carnosus]CAF1371326.1 unnamed protein product [Didymodactylos carnosus]CAF3841101.1 unnamed protein product [Didymodactylos carnosus]CAF4257922.1 unnamed protein product [Didymodactylos carnosus]